MELLDPITRRPLPADSIQRILFMANNVHVYAIPPLTSMEGHKATSWTSTPERQIFTGRLRLIETSTESTNSESNFKVDLVLENSDTGELFVAAPFADANVIEPATDSSRFFAVTVRDESNRKAFLGIGFENRPDAFEFSVAVQQAYKAFGWIQNAANDENSTKTDQAPAKDYSLKEGQTITVNLSGLKMNRRRSEQQQQEDAFDQTPPSSTGGFPLPPPPSANSRQASSSASASAFILPPPPSAKDVKSKRKSLVEFGFDNGQSGEFE